jgi:ABC-2 type transport system permease protein
MSVKIIPYLIMSFGLWIMYWLFTLWFRIPFYDNLLTFVAGVFVISVIGVLVSILVPNQLKATEILMVIATPSFYFEFYKSNASLGSGHFNVIPLHF